VIVAQRKKGSKDECSLLSKADDGLFRRGDLLCPEHVAELKKVFMFTAHPVKRATAEEKKVLAAVGLPSTRYRICRAPTSRSTCKAGCGNIIEEGTLRFGTDHRFGSHYESHWRHLECVTAEMLPSMRGTVHGCWSDLLGFETLSCTEQSHVIQLFSGLSERSSRARKANAESGRDVQRPSKFLHLKEPLPQREVIELD